MTDKERDSLSKRIDDLQAAGELTVKRLKELEWDTFRQRSKRKLHADPFYQASMDRLNGWGDESLSKSFKKLWRRYFAKRT